MAAKASSATESSPRSGENNKKKPATLYITIGPQCCGKTTVLNDFDGVQDVCLDDQLDVYVSVSTRQWLNLLKASPSKEERKDGELTIPEELQRIVQGKTVAQRIQNDNPELNLILKRWNGDLSATEFADSLSQHYANNTQSRNHRDNGTPTTPNEAKVLILVVEDFLSKEPPLPAKTDVFCLESLFKPHAKTNESAIQVAHDIVKAASLDIPLAWGNTNSKAKDFQQVLDIACSAKRPVQFVLCHPTWKLQNGKCNIPWLELSTLLSRNLQRLEATGRYIPANAIVDCCQRIQDQLIPSDCKSAWDVEQALVYQSTQPVRRDEKPLPFRYRLTRERLIRKEYPERQPPHPLQGHQDHRREHPTTTGKEIQYSRGRPPQQQNGRLDRFRDSDRQRPHRGPPQDDDRRFDDRRRYDDEDPSRRRGGGYNHDRYAGGGGMAEDRRRQSQEPQPPSRGKRGYQDRRDGNSSYPPSEDNRKRYRR